MGSAQPATPSATSVSWRRLRAADRHRRHQEDRPNEFGSLTSTFAGAPGCQTCGLGRAVTQAEPIDSSVADTIATALKD